MQLKAEGQLSEVQTFLGRSARGQALGGFTICVDAYNWPQHPPTAGGGEHNTDNQKKDAKKRKIKFANCIIKNPLRAPPGFTIFHRRGLLGFSHFA